MMENAKKHNKIPQTFPEILNNLQKLKVTNEITELKIQL